MEMETEEKILTQEKVEDLLKSGNWILRFDDNGESYNGFRWNEIGEWTEALDWESKAECGNGLHGQSPKGAGFCKPGSRMVLCETKGRQVVIKGDKVKVRYAKIIAVNDDIPVDFLINLMSIGGSLNLDGYRHPLPDSIQSIGGYLNLDGYRHPLPDSIQSIGGYLYLEGYGHPLPDSIQSIGGYLYLGGYGHPLPDSIQSIGGYLDLRGYGHPLPEKLKKSLRA